MHHPDRSGRLARQGTSLSPAKKALLEKWGAGSRFPHEAAIERRPLDVGSVPISFVQERQLFLERLTPQTAVNNISISLRVKGPLNAGNLARSAHRILARHESLRTSFEMNQGPPLARVSSDVTLAFPIEDLHSFGSDAVAEALRRAETLAAQPIDLSRPPLLRLRLFRLSSCDHLLHIAIHHSIGDGWSVGVLIKELFQGYRDFENGGWVEPGELPIQYADFAHWQRQFLKGPHLDRLLDFWKRTLAGELPLLELPTDHPRPPRQTFRGGTHRFTLPKEVSDRIKEVGRDLEVTPFMTLMAAFLSLLYRLSGQEDLLVGTPVAGRLRPETEGLIGAFINTLVLRTDLSGEPSFRELLFRVRDVALDAYGHQELPFERLVAELRPERDPSRSPLTQVMFNLQNSPLPPLNVPGLSLEVISMDRNTSPVDLSLILSETTAGMEGAFEYSTDLFAPSTIDRLSDSFVLLLEDALGHPEKKISKLAILSDAERHRLLVALNATRADYPREKGVEDLFEAQVERTPDATAVVSSQTKLTYRELDTWAEDLAEKLRLLGVGPGVPVGVFMDRSAALLAGLLAVMKSGGAYLPIDPTLPHDRVEFMLRDAGARVLLVDSPESSAGGIEGIRSVGVGNWLGAAADPLGAKPRARRPGGASDALAYLIYTSGSTGRPKGVAIRRGALINLLWAMRELVGIRAGDRLLAVTSVSFDIAALELFLPLITGATVVLAGREITRDRRRLEEVIKSEGITVMQATPSAWRLLLGGGWRGRAGLVALSGGEPLTPELADQLLDRVGTLWNLYGPTETTVWSTACQVRAGDRPIMIGRPIANTQCYILDSRLEPVPVGVAGELHIGGEGLAAGYLNQPELSAERFIPNPMTQDGAPGGCLYKTGDRARLRADGSIEHLGRLDHQVKLHGFRIELGEIEAVLIRHPSVLSVAVLARESTGGYQHLAAFVVPKEGPAPTPDLLREFLRASLPAYMIPPVFVFLKEMPLTRAGKVDRKSLPTAALPPRETIYVAPRTPLEDTLAATIARVLGMERVGVQENFFDLGGGSIQILEIIARVQEQGWALTPEMFFEHQTIQALAESVSRGRHDC
jgi:amino acid adenylation domain-containing protein